MQPKPRSRFALALAVAVTGLTSLSAAHADTYVGRLIAEDLFDKLKFSGRIAVWPVDTGQARAAAVTPAEANMLADNIRVAVHHLGAAKGLTFVEREGISKVFQEQQFAHNAKDSDFETLAHQANADALVLISLERESPADIVVSARLVRAKGAAVGQILATSKTYEVAMTETALADPPAPAPPLTAETVAPPRAPAPSQTIQPLTVTPTTVTPTPAAPAYSAYYYAPAYTVSPAVPYVYPATTAYYVRPYARPRLGYAVAYGRWGWRR